MERRENVEAYTEDGNYIKMKKSAVKITKVESDGDKKPATSTAAAAAAAVASSTNIEVDIINHVMIILSPLPAHKEKTF
jgi:hypothetical protein